LSYLLLRVRETRFYCADEYLSPTQEAKTDSPGSRLSAGTPVWPALLGVTLLVTSPFLYCFGRLAILEPLQTTLTLAALNLAVRLPGLRRPVAGAAWVGLLLALTTLTKTTALFLAPAIMWAIVVPLWQTRGLAIRCGLVAMCTAAAAYGLWMALIGGLGLMNDYRYYFFVNRYDKPAEFYWPFEALWWSFHGLLWVDHSLIPLAGALVLAAAIAWRSKWGRDLWRNPLFGVSLWVVAGYVLFMTLQNHPQPRYFAVPAFFCFFIVALGAETLLCSSGWLRTVGWAVLSVATASAGVHAAQTIRYAAHPEYTWVNAATQLTQYIDAHANGKRLLVSISGDEITLITGLPTLCDDFGTQDLDAKIGRYQPGWYASWNDLDPGTLDDLHTRFSLEQVATFKAFDDPDRDLLVLFKLHPLPAGEVRSPGEQNLKVALPGDQIEIPIE
jgi:hypothetical protein